MEQRYIVIALLTAAGFIAGGIAADVIGVESWLDAKLLITLSTGAAFVLGRLLTRNDKK